MTFVLMACSGSAAMEQESSIGPVAADGRDAAVGVQQHADVLWMLWLVPAAAFSAVSAWGEARRQRWRVPGAKSSSRSGWVRLFEVAALFCTVMAGMDSTGSSMPWWARVAVIVLAVAVPAQLATVVTRRRRRRAVLSEGEGRRDAAA